jgi:hypothetical protein
LILRLINKRLHATYKRYKQLHGTVHVCIFLRTVIQCGKTFKCLTRSLGEEPIHEKFKGKNLVATTL